MTLLKGRSMHQLRGFVAVLGTCFLFLSCSSTHPYRTVVPDEGTRCAAGPGPDSCPKSAWETENAYNLFYVEFDDQGLLHPPEELSSGDASKQFGLIDRVLRDSYGSDCVNIIVYVHGWKHDARTTDKDVNEFRKLMLSEALLEANTPDPHKVVGIFVGWRGQSATLEPFKELSFWDRKGTALKVAEGSARDLFSHLQAYQQARNASWTPPQHEANANEGTAFRCPGSHTNAHTSAPRPPVRMLIVGHSFGAQVVFYSLSPYLTAALADSSDQSKATLRRYGDMVILLNPAFEATGFVPLFQEATGFDHHRVYSYYQAPVLVSITSKADQATGFWFPVGRFFSTLLEDYSSDAERSASLRTVGHVSAYLTHELYWKKEAGDCTRKGWQPPGNSADQLKLDLDIEKQVAEDFFKQFQKGSDRPVLEGDWKRPFCGGSELQFVGSARGINANVPIWNVRTYKQIIPSHSEIETEVLESFVRQVYRDSILYPGL